MFVSSRRGSAENGGFLLSGWDGFFMGMLLAKDDPALARVCVHAQLGGAAVLGFVSGESAGRGVALGRTMPPVGGICLAEIYRITQDREFAEECFERLLLI